MGMLMYERRGPAAAQAEEFVGINELARGRRRCAQCAERSDCRGRAAFCPNGSLLLRAQVLAGGLS